MRFRFSACHRAALAVMAERREAASISQRELSRLMDRPHNYIYLVEKGQRMIGLCELLEYLHHVGADPAEVVTEIVKRSRRVKSRPRAKSAGT